jgi:ketosteroid isomerase-like protein
MLGHRRSWLACGLLVLSAAVCRADPAPPAVAQLYEDLRIAMDMKDLQAILARFSPMMQLEVSLSGGRTVDLIAICREHEALATEVKIDDTKVVGDLALVISTWAISGKTTATGEPWSTTQRQVDVLRRAGPNWEIDALYRIAGAAPGAEPAEETYQDPATGLAVSAPAKWRLYPVVLARGGAVAISPDLKAQVAWLVTDVPGTATAEEIMRSAGDVIDKLGPTANITSREPSSGPATLAGRPSYQMSRVLAPQNGPELFSWSNACLVGNTVYIASVRVCPAGDLAAHRADIERAVASTQIAEPQLAAPPPEAGRAEGRRYVNETHGCEIMAPEGWQMKVEQGEFKLQVSMREPGGASSLTLGMVAIPADAGVTAEQAVKGDDALSATIVEQFKVVRQGPTQVGDLPAYESVTQFTAAGQPRTRWRVYLIDGGRLFFIFADAVPSEKWDRLEKLFKETIQSLKLVPTQPAP